MAFEFNHGVKERILKEHRPTKALQDFAGELEERLQELKTKYGEDCKVKSSVRRMFRCKSKGKTNSIFAKNITLQSSNSFHSKTKSVSIPASYPSWFRLNTSSS